MVWQVKCGVGLIYVRCTIQKICKNWAGGHLKLKLRNSNQLFGETVQQIRKIVIYVGGKTAKEARGRKLNL